MKAKHLTIVTLLVAVMALLSLSNQAHAATAAGAGITIDGNYIGGYTITWDDESRDDLVKQLTIRPLTFQRDYQLQVDAKDPNLAILKGRIGVLSKAGGIRQVMTVTHQLKLVNRDGRWFVDAVSLQQALVAALLAGNSDESERIPDHAPVLPT